MVDFPGVFAEMERLGYDGWAVVEQDVLIDDLDRCLPDTAIETLEAIRLFVLTSRTAFVVAADEAMIRSAIAAHIPAVDGKLLSAQTCLYTMTPDGDFILDRLPGCAQIIVAAPCSGHGFKFAPVIGEILADLAVTGRTDYDISRFRLARFSPSPPSPARGGG